MTFKIQLAGFNAHRRLLALTMTAVLVVTIGAWAASRSRTSGLPFYASADFTPAWTPSPPARLRFSLRSQTGGVFSDRDLAGRVYLASFIYTRCTGLCPTLVSNLRRFERGTAGRDVLLVSYTVTPDLDTPKVLAEFGGMHGIDASRWKLVTGDRQQIYRLAREVYFSSDERLATSLNAPNALLHTEKLVLVDTRGRLRGVYNGTQPFDIDHAVADAEALLTEPPK
jgi:protein SCO1/2